jgi:vitamin B12 transporter
MKRILLGSAAFAVLNFGAALAAGVPAAPVEEVLITGRLEEELPQELADVGVRVQEIPAETIENFGYHDIAQTLQSQVPGLFLAPSSGAFDYVSASFQGSRINEILWLVDGVRVSNRLYNTTSPLDTLPAHAIERIEVIEGGQALFYGTSAVAGAVNIVTKEFSPQLGGRASAGIDSHDGRHINAWVRDAIGAHHFVLYGSHDSAEGFQPYLDEDYTPSTTDRNRGYELFVLGAKYALDLSEALRFSAQWQRTDATRLDNLRPARSSTGQVGGMAESYNARVQNLASAKIDYTASDMMRFFVKGYYHEWDAYFNQTRNVIGSPGDQVVISDNEFWGFKDYGLNVMGQFNFGMAEIFAGYDYQNYSGRDDVLLIADNSEQVHALFAQVRSTPGALGNAMLAAGLRYNAPSNTDSAVIWNISGQYNFSDTLYVKANGGTAFRLPDAYELFAIDPFCCFGNPDLKPERSINLNASVGGNFPIGQGVITLEAIGFYRRIEDLIVDVDDGTGSGNTITANVDDEVRVRGFTLFAGANFTASFSGTASYTYSNTEGSSGIAGGYDQVPGIPVHQFQATLDYHPDNLPFGAAISLNRVGEIIDSVGGIGDVPSGDYFVVDVAGRVFLDGMRRHRLNLRVENVLDEEYFTGHARGFPDTAPLTGYLIHRLGTPRTFHVNYSFNF